MCERVRPIDQMALKLPSSIIITKMDAYTTGNAKFVDEDYAAAIEVGGVLKATMPLWMQPFHRQVNDVIVTIRNAIFLKNKKRENQSR